MTKRSIRRTFLRPRAHACIDRASRRDLSFGRNSSFGCALSPRTSRFRTGDPRHASVLIIVLWVALGLVSITLYFASSMSYEIRAADNRVSGLATEQAITGAERYIAYILGNLPTNGVMPDPESYQNSAVPVGDTHFWLIGRNNDSQLQTPDQITFGLVDEASKLNLNTVSSNVLVMLPNITSDLVAGIVDWRYTNGGLFQTYYSMQHPPYNSKNGSFETVNELRMVYGASLEELIGEDPNCNGVLDPNEKDLNGNGTLDPGILEYVTVYSREPNTNAIAGTALVNVSSLTAGSSNAMALQALMETNLPSGRAAEIMQRLLPSAAAGSRPGTTGGQTGGNQRGGNTPVAAAAPPLISASPLQFYMQASSRAQMTEDEFASIANYLTVTNGQYIEGRVNINTASATVLGCLPGIQNTADLAQTLVTYRQNNSGKLTSVAWVTDALGQNNTDALNSLASVDCITTQSFQFTADVAAIGPYGRGYRRVRFVFDTADGTPKVIFRQDLTHLGWALGKNVRQNWLAANSTSTSTR